MTKKEAKAVENTKTNEPNEAVETNIDTVETPTKAKLKAVIEAYKAKSPAKYELKKEALEAQLKNL